MRSDIKNKNNNKKTNIQHNGEKRRWRVEFMVHFMSQSMGSIFCRHLTLSLILYALYAIVCYVSSYLLLSLVSHSHTHYLLYRNDDWVEMSHRSDWTIQVHHRKWANLARVKFTRVWMSWNEFFAYRNFHINALRHQLTSSTVPLCCIMMSSNRYFPLHAAVVVLLLCCYVDGLHCIAMHTICVSKNLFFDALPQ